MSTPSMLVADRYRLVKLLGAGGMGVVWQAWDERLERAVALKMLRTQPELTNSEREIATNRVMREARITAGLHHPHAVTVYDVVEHEGQPCLVMQLVESTPLSILLREHGTLTPEQAARIGAEIASALAAAHKMRIVHRDVKPGNILITEDGSAMISDFGISHALGDATITATGLIHGTPAYLAPEVARGRPSAFASDVFSLGSSLYAMVEGHPPFGADKNAIALLHKVARGGYPPPKHAGVLAPLLAEMLSADPKRRPTMTAIAASLSAMRGGGSSAALPVGGAALTATGVALTAPIMPTDAASAALPATGVALTAPITPTDAASTTPVIDDVPPPSEDRDAAAAAATEALTEPVEDEPVEEDPFFEWLKPPADPPTPATIRIDQGPTTEASTLQAPPGRTVPMDQPTRFEPPTAETEPLGRAAPAAAGTPVVAPQRDRPAPGPGASPPTPPAPPRRRRTGAVVGLVLLAAVAVVIAAVVLFNPFRQDAGGAAAPTSQAPEPTSTAASQSPSPTPSTSPSPTASTPPPPVVTPPPPTVEQRVVQTITGYYALVPGNLDNAWPTMTADYQQNHAGGRRNYDAFWRAIASVDVADVTATAPDQGQATLTYHYNDGRVVQEVTAFRLVDEGGVLKIAGSDVLSSVDL